MGQWTLHDSRFMELLHRAHSGEDPDMLWLEEYANAEQGWQEQWNTPKTVRTTSGTSRTFWLALALTPLAVAVVLGLIYFVHSTTTGV